LEYIYIDHKLFFIETKKFTMFYRNESDPTLNLKLSTYCFPVDTDPFAEPEENILLLEEQIEEKILKFPSFFNFISIVALSTSNKIFTGYSIYGVSLALYPPQQVEEFIKIIPSIEGIIKRIYWILTFGDAIPQPTPLDNLEDIDIIPGKIPKFKPFPKAKTFPKYEKVKNFLPEIPPSSEIQDRMEKFSKHKILDHDRMDYFLSMGYWFLLHRLEMIEKN